MKTFLHRKRVLAVGILFSSLFLTSNLVAALDPFSLDRLNFVYDIFLCEEKNATSSVNLTTPCDVPPPTPPKPSDCGVLLSPPTIPALAQTRPASDLVPFVLVNNTGLSDDSVYFVIYGREVAGTCPSDGNFSFVAFTEQSGHFVGATGGAAEATGDNTPPASDYSYRISDIPSVGGQRIIYLPYIESGILLFSIDHSLPLTVGNNSIAIPVVTNPSDPSYSYVFGGMEVTFYPPSCPVSGPLNQLTVDFTCVDYYGLSLYFNLYTQTPSPGLPQNRPSGIYQSREYMLCALQGTLATAHPAALSQWESLVLKDGDRTLRVVSPGYSMGHNNAGGTFDVNYWNNLASYHFSWARDVWIGPEPYYGSRQLQLTTEDGTVYTGQIDDENFVFTATLPGSNIEKLGIPWSNSPLSPSNFTTSTALFNVAEYFPGMTYSLNGSGPCVITDGGCSVPSATQTRATQITQYLSAAIAAGIVPGKVTSLTSAGPSPSVISEYYQPNTNLNPPGSTTGPWYDLYSLGFFVNSSETGNAVYTYAYDDYLYQQSSIKVAPSQATIDDTTYVTIVLGPYSDN